MERTDELARIDAVLAAACARTGATLLIEGPAGIGKTALLMHARERASATGARVLHARASQLEREYPLGVVRQWLEPLLREHPDADRLFSGAAGLTRSVLLDVADDLATVPVGVLHGLYWLIANLADRGPLLLAVDDAHWADEPSLRFLAYLAGRIDSLPAVLAICTRPDERGAGDRPLAEIGREPATTVLRPAPLDAAGVEDYLRTAVAGHTDSAFARACHGATGGNPFLLGELVRALRADGVPFTAAGAAQVTEIAPPTVARTVRDTLDRLGPAARALARAVDVLGDDVPVDLAAELAELPIMQAGFAAGELARAGLLQDATRLRFRHAILAAAVRADQGAFERAAAHRRAAELLRARGAGAERVALQLLHSPPAGDEEVVAQLRQAAAYACARGAPATAVALLHRALAEPASAAARGDLLLEAGQAEYAVGRSADAATHLDEAHRCAIDASTRGRALLALFQARAGSLPELRALAPLFERTLPEVAERDRELALRLWALKLVVTPSGPAWEEAARGAAALTGATPGEAVVLGHLTLPMMKAGATAADIADIAERAARQADALLEEGVTALVITGIVLGLVWTDRLQGAEELLNRGIAVARRRGATADFALAHTHRASVHRRAGRLREAEADARVSQGAGGDPGWAGRGTGAIIPLVGTLVDQGRIDDAARELVGAHAADDVADAPAMTALLLERMRLSAAQGRHRRALSDWEEARRRAARLFGIGPDWVPDLLAAAGSHHALGEADARDELLSQALAFAERWGLAGFIGEARHAVARLAGGDDAADMLRDAVEQLGRSPARLELARALVSLGAVLRRRGARIDSREPLREGHELARRCGALGLAETARAELRASGIRLRREALSGVDALTASERRIAGMAAGGASNAEIAQGLFVTVKTVEMHLTRAYRKLDISRRSELPQALARDM